MVTSPQWLKVFRISTFLGNSKILFRTCFRLWPRVELGHLVPISKDMQLGLFGGQNWHICYVSCIPRNNSLWWESQDYLQWRTSLGNLSSRIPTGQQLSITNPSTCEIGRLSCSALAISFFGLLFCALFAVFLRFTKSSTSFFKTSPPPPLCPIHIFHEKSSLEVLVISVVAFIAQRALLYHRWIYLRVSKMVVLRGLNSPVLIFSTVGSFCKSWILLGCLLCGASLCLCVMPTVEASAVE